MSNLAYRACFILQSSGRPFAGLSVLSSMMSQAKSNVSHTTPLNGETLFTLPQMDLLSDFRNLTKKVTFKALRIPKESLQALLKGGIKKRTVRRLKFNFVRPAEEVNFRYLLLDPDAVEDFDSWRECSVLAECNIEKKLKDYDVTLTYEDFNANEVLRALLPPSIEVPTAFSRIGHIAHMNLRDEQMPFKQIIGEVMLDKIPSIQTIVNKTNEISNQYRVFNMEVIAGEDNFVTSVREHHCTFHLDFSKVYWNPRLGTEHERIVQKVGKQVLFDVFAGIGPFAVPAAKGGCLVYANDLNPDSFAWLQKNIASNKVERMVQCYNLDGRTFIATILKEQILKIASGSREDKPQRVHIAMNLPASAMEFLDAFKGLLTGSGVEAENIPPLWVHCYCFTKEEDIEASAQRMVEEHLGGPIQHPEIHNVRNVAPNKEMMCVTFEMPAKILWENEQTGASKRTAPVGIDEDPVGDGKRTKVDVEEVSTNPS